MTITIAAPLFNLTDCTFVTARVETRNSSYEVISRSWGVVVVCTRGTHQGMTFRGDYIWMRPSIENGGMHLTLNGEPVLWTTAIVGIEVHEN